MERRSRGVQVRAMCVEPDGGMTRVAGTGTTGPRPRRRCSGSGRAVGAGAADRWRGEHSGTQRLGIIIITR